MLPYILDMAFIPLSPATGSLASLRSPSVTTLTLTVRIQFANHYICRMTDSGTPDAGNITPQKTHPGLLQRIVTLLRLSQRLVNLIHRRLKRCKLDHRIRYLPPPKRIQALIQPCHPFLRRHLRPPFPQPMRIRRQRRLHPHFYCLKRAEGDIGEKLSGRGSAEVDEGLVGVGEELLSVIVFEDLVKAVFPCALEGVADGCRAPAEEDAGDAFFGEDGAPRGEIGGVNVWVNLAAAFYLELNSV